MCCLRISQRRNECSHACVWGVQLANVQSNSQFASHQLNRDTWSNATVKDIVQGCFVFWQVTRADSSSAHVSLLTPMPACLLDIPVTFSCCVSVVCCTCYGW